MEQSEKYPNLVKIEEIVDFINKLGYRIDKGTIETTDSDTIIELYASLFEKLEILKKEKLKFNFSTLSKFNLNHQHEKYIQIMKLFNYMKVFVNDVLNIDNFTTADLFTPNPKRTKKILAGIMKYHKFKIGEKEHYLFLKQEVESSITKFKEVNDKYQRTFNKYQETKEKKEKEKPEIDELYEKINILSDTTKDLQQTICEQEATITEKSHQATDLEEKIKSIDYLNENLTQKIQNLKNQIVTSPEKIQLSLEEKKNNIELLAESVSELESELKNLDKHQKYLEAINKHFNDFQGVVQNLEKAIGKLENANRNSEEEIDAKHKRERIVEELTGDIKNLEKSLIDLDVYSLDFFERQKKLIESKEETLISNKEKITQLNKVTTEKLEAIKLQVITNKSLEENINELDKLKEDYYNHIEGLMQNLHSVVIQYSQSIVKMLDSQ